MFGHMISCAAHPEEDNGNESKDEEVSKPRVPHPRGYSSCFRSRFRIRIHRKTMVMRAMMRIMRKETVTPMKADVSRQTDSLRPEAVVLITTSGVSSGVRENWTSLGART